MGTEVIVLANIREYLPYPRHCSLITTICRVDFNDNLYTGELFNHKKEGKIDEPDGHYSKCNTPE